MKTIKEFRDTVFEFDGVIEAIIGVTILTGMTILDSYLLIKNMKTKIKYKIK